MDPQKLSEQLIANHGKMLSEYRKVWIGLIQTALSDYLKEFKKILRNGQRSDNYWPRLESFIAKQNLLCSNSEKIIRDYRKKDFWEISDSHYDRFYEEYPESFSVPVTSDDWQPKDTDTYQAAAWKFAKRNTRRIVLFYFHSVNRIRSILKKSMLEIPAIPPRNIAVPLLAAKYFQWPLNENILHEWAVFQMRTGKIIYEIHDCSERVFNTIVIKGREHAFAEETAKADSAEITAELKEIYAALESSIEEFNNAVNDKEIDQDMYHDLARNFALKWQYCGTAVLNSDDYDINALKREREAVNENLLRTNNNWELQFAGEFGDWKRDLQLTLVQLKTIAFGENLLINVQKSVDSDIIPQFSQNREQVDGCIEKVKSWDDLTRTKTRAALKRENRQLIKGLAHDKFLLLVDTIFQTNLLDTMQGYKIALKSEVEQIPEKQTLLARRDLESLVPNPKIHEIPGRELLDIYGYEPLISEHQLLIQSSEKIHRGTLRTISMMDQIIDFQFETAAGLLQQKKSENELEEVKKVLVEGLERLTGQFDDLIVDYQSFMLNSQNSIIDMSNNFIDSIQMLEDSERVFELNLKLSRAKTESKYRDLQRKFQNSVNKAVTNTLRLFRNALKKLFNSFRRLRKITGIEQSKVRVEDEIQRLLTLSYSPLDKLPLVYQRLFKIEEVSEERFFFQRHSEYSSLEADFKDWQDDPVSPVVLVGEKGSGKSTLIEYIKNRIYFDYTVYECTPKVTVDRKDELFGLLLSAFGMEGINSLEELEKKILEEAEPCVFVFENIQRLFLRKVGGFKALQRLLLFITGTSSKVYWVISCSLYTWEFLDRAINCSKYFHRIITMQELSVEEIAGIIMQRHRTSGFELLFQPTPSLMKSSKYRKLQSEKERQKYLREIFFEDLHDIAQGNIAVAMLFWINAILEISKDELVLSMVLSWDQSPFQKMPADELFTLGAIIQHDGLTIAQHAQVFYQDFAKSQSIITRLKNNGLLIENDLGYSIQPILYRPIVKVLKNKNILH